MPIDLTQIKKKILPPQDGQDELKLRVGTVQAIGSDGTVTVTLSGVNVPGVAVLSGAAFAVGTVVQVLSYRGSLLVIGASNAVTSQPVEASGSTTNGTYASGAYGNSLTTTGVHGVAFIAPASGKIQIIGRAMGGNNNAGSYTQLDYEVRQGSTIGSGTLVRTTNNNTAGIHQSATASSQGTMVTGGLLAGLTPGAAYNACLTYATGGAGTASYNRRQIAVYPQ